MRLLTLLLFALPAIVTASPFACAQSPEGMEYFEKKIRPVLVEHCYQCHSAEADKAKNLKAGLRLDTRQGILKGGRSGPALVPGKAKGSLLIAAIRHEDLRMPPKGKLSDAVIADFEAWVVMGAPDPRDGKLIPLVAQIDWDKARQAWVFQKPVTHKAPKVKGGNWPRQEMDSFVLAELEKRGLTPVRAATRQEWIRRATFDLIGLPPTPAEVDVFVNDSSADAFAKVVDRLLASPHYGERWGRYWLDLARYTDDLGGTVGPVPAPNAYRYRDWVIQAFNRDMPYDQFIRLQLAGDLITEPAADYVERLAGLGFQGLGQRFSGNAVGMVKKKVADELDDRVDTVTRALLGLTVSCARCHDHKFDPIPTVDYYSLAAAYNGAKVTDEIILASPTDIKASDIWKKQVAELTQKTAKLTQDEASILGRDALMQVDRYLISAWQLHLLAKKPGDAGVKDWAQREGLHPFFLERWVKLLAQGKPLPLLGAWQTLANDSARIAKVKADRVEVPKALAEASAQMKTLAVEVLRDWDKSVGKKPKLSGENDAFLKVFLLNDGAYFKLSSKEVIALLSPDSRIVYDKLQAELSRLNQAPPPPMIKGPAVTGGGQTMQINVRGNPDQLGETAPPGFLQILQRTNAPASSKFTRLDLADAIANRSNPLTARVYVNRLWHYHFGRGIVGTASNFGQLGDRPTHPELLDSLAVRFMDNGWSTKWLHREIMLSATYGLSSSPDAKNLAKDADNHLLWRVSPRRLDFEAWRDAMLATAGKLDPKVGGPAFFDPQGAVQLHPEDPKNRRRTIYGFISRFKPNPTLTLFDFPEPNVTSDQRNTTTIPQQQLFALNSPFVVAMAQSFAARVEAEEKTESRRLLLAWKLAFGRVPTEREMTIAAEFLGGAAAQEEKLRPWERLCHSLLTTNEFAFVP